VKAFSFEGSVCLDTDGNVSCFCYSDQDQCSCSEDPNCFSAVIDISLLSRKSSSKKLEEACNKISNNLKTAENKIKEGISALEKAIDKNKHFRI
jgi:hypothetical protein